MLPTKMARLPLILLQYGQLNVINYLINLLTTDKEKIINGALLILRLCITIWRAFNF